MFTATASVEDRYQAVCRLIGQGATVGERDAARLAARRMEATRPNLRSGRPLARIMEGHGLEQDLHSYNEHTTYTGKFEGRTITATVSADGWQWTVQVRPRTAGTPDAHGWFGLDLYKALRRAKFKIVRCRP